MSVETVQYLHAMSQIWQNSDPMWLRMELQLPQRWTRGKSRSIKFLLWLSVYQYVCLRHANLSVVLLVFVFEELHHFVRMYCEIQEHLRDLPAMKDRINTPDPTWGEPSSPAWIIPEWSLRALPAVTRCYFEDLQHLIQQSRETWRDPPVHAHHNVITACWMDVLCTKW